LLAAPSLETATSGTPYAGSAADTSQVSAGSRMPVSITGLEATSVTTFGCQMNAQGSERIKGRDALAPPRTPATTAEYPLARCVPPENP
jgi:hypothetical protein